MPFKFRFDGDVWSDTWMWEILSIILSGISLVSTFVVLKVHAQKPPPHFIYGITLNAIISFLTTLSKSSLLVAVAGAMSQLKWQWFQSAKGRSVLDTQLFDNASRGPWGSAILLATPHSWSLVSMGAVVSILALAFDPFAQQLLNYPTQTTVAADPASRASNIYRAQSFVMGRPDRAYSGVFNRVLASSWGQLSEAENFVAAQCPTGNCTWDEFESLALCSACQNRTSDIEIFNSSLFWNASVGKQVLDTMANSGFISGYASKEFSMHSPTDCSSIRIRSSLRIRGAVFQNHSSSRFASEITYLSHLFGAFTSVNQVWLLNNTLHVDTSNVTEWQLHSLPIIRFCHIQLHRETHEGQERISTKHATTCQLTPCVKRYLFSISNGVPTLNTIGDRYGSWFFNATGLELRGDNELYYENGGELFKGILGLSWSDMQGNNGRLLNLNNTAFPRMLFTIDERYSLPLLSIGSVFEGAITVIEGFADDERNQVSNASGIQFKKEFFVGSSPFPDALEPRTLNLQQIVDNGGLPWVLPRVAADLSRYIREQDGIPVLGQTFITTTIVEIRWLWLLFPVVIWLCATAFLVLTMWTGRGGDKVLWKTSSLPLVYHGLGAREVEIMKTAVGGMEKVSDMEKSAKSLHARLRRDSINGQLKLSSAKAQEIELI